MEDEKSSNDTDIERTIVEEEQNNTANLEHDISLNISRKLNESVRQMMSESKRTSLRDPLDTFSHSHPETEFEVTQLPSTHVVQEYRNVLEEHGVDYLQIQQIAHTFDLLRQTRRSSAQMIEHNSDRQMNLVFIKKFKAVLDLIKQDNHQKSP